MLDSKKKFIFLTDGYFPVVNANIVCADILADYFKKKGHEVDFYVVKNSFDEIEKKEKGSNIFYFENVYSSIFFKFQKQNVKYSELSTLKKLSSKIINKVKRIAIPKISGGLADTILIKPVLEKILEQSKEKKYDYIISFVHPFGLTRVAQKVKQKFPHIKWVTYMLDPYVYNYNNCQKLIPKRKKLFSRYTKRLDNLLMLKGIYEENERQGYDNGQKGITAIIDLPMLRRLDIENNVQENLANDEIECLYAGAFYESYRNPTKILDIFSKLNDERIKLKLLSWGCEEIIDAFKLKQGEKLVKLSPVPPNEYLKMASDTNIMINIGATTPSQISCKIFDAIALGKPIINFFFNKHDPTLLYLKLYPLCYNIDLNDFNQNVIEGLERFILDNRDKVLTFEQATANLKEYISDAVCDDTLKTIIGDEKFKSDATKKA